MRTPGIANQASGASRAALAVAALSFGVAAAVFLAGAGRSYGYDESVTVGTFVATPSLLDPFRRQVVFNNHPLFSFAEHLVWSGGGRSETWLRFLPAMFGAASIAILAWWLARRWGAVAGSAAAAVLITHPLFASSARTVRGYSLLCLCAVVSTLLAVELVERGERRWRSVVYVVAVAAGLAVHLYMGFIVTGHLAFVVARRAMSRQWRVRWYAATLIGTAAYLGMLSLMAGAARSRGRLFRLGFPLDLARALFGTHALAAAVLAVVVATSTFVWGRRREVVLPIVAVMAMLAAVWIVLAPTDLYPRFFVWLVPGVASLAALAVARRRSLVVPVVVAVVTMAAHQVAEWPEDDRALPRAAAIVDAARESQQTPCAVGGEALSAYTTPPREILPDASGCDVVIVILSGVRLADSAFREVQRLGPIVRVLRR